MNTFERVLFLIKTHGPRSAQEVAAALGLTSMGARRHLEQAAQQGLARHQDSAEGVGRPTRRWSLTEAGHARFPDRHADLTVQLLDSVRQVFGPQGMERLISARELETEQRYRSAMAGAATLAQRLAALAALRAEEGYMAELAQDADGAALLVENHCPICAAARACAGFCRSELALFQRVLGPECRVERSEHLLGGARRCAYRITPV